MFAKPPYFSLVSSTFKKVAEKTETDLMTTLTTMIIVVVLVMVMMMMVMHISYSSRYHCYYYEKCC